MKKLLFVRLCILLIALGFGLTNCSKSKINGGDSDTSTLQQLSKDQANVQAASDDGLDDANNVITPGTPGTSKGGGHWAPPHSTLDSAGLIGDTMVYTINYNGNNEWGNRSRTGKIIIKKSLLSFWFEPGSIVYVSFLNYKVTKLSDNKTIILNGTKKFENVSGGFIPALGLEHGVSQVVQQVSGTLNVTFDDSTTRVWNIACRRTFTGDWFNLVMTTDGFGSQPGYSNLITWGTDRNGELFYTQITQSVVNKISPPPSTWGCGLTPLSGSMIHQVPSGNKTATVTFGYGINNQPVSSSGTDCPVKYKLDWVKNGRSGTLYILI